MLPPVALLISAPAYCSSGFDFRLRLWPKMSSLVSQRTQALNNVLAYRCMSRTADKVVIDHHGR